jgi:hypothetical protein
MYPGKKLEEVGRSRALNEQKHVDYFLDLVGSDDIGMI